MEIRHAMTVRHPVPSFWVILTSRDEISVLQYVVVCCSVLQYVAGNGSRKRTCAIHTSRETVSVLQCVAVS